MLYQTFAPLKRAPNHCLLETLYFGLEGSCTWFCLWQQAILRFTSPVSSGPYSVHCSIHRHYHMSLLGAQALSLIIVQGTCIIICCSVYMLYHLVLYHLSWSLSYLLTQGTCTITGFVQYTGTILHSGDCSVHTCALSLFCYYVCIISYPVHMVYHLFLSLFCAHALLSISVLVQSMCTAFVLVLSVLAQLLSFGVHSHSSIGSLVNHSTVSLPHPCKR